MGRYRGASAWVGAVITSVLIEFSDGRAAQTITGAKKVTIVSDDGTPPVVVEPPPAPPPSTYKHNLKIPKGGTFPTGQIADTKIEFECGGAFESAVWWDVKDKVKFGAYGTGPAPILKNTKAGSNIYPTILLLKGDGIEIDGLSFDAGPNKNTRAISGNGCRNVTIRNLTYASIGWFFHWTQAENVIIEDCGSPVAPYVYDEYFELGNAPTHSRNFRHRRVKLKGGPNAHAGRGYGADDIEYTDCEIDGWNSRTSYTMKSGSFRFINCKIRGNIDVGDGIPYTKPEEIAMGKTFKVSALFDNCDIDLNDPTVITVRRDSVATINNCRIKTPVKYAVELKNDSGYAQPRATVTNCTITGPPGTQLVKGLVSNVTQSGNKIN